MTAAAGATIYALASGGARAGVAVLRVSGPDAITFAERLAGGRTFAPRKATLARLRDAAGEEIDRGLVLTFPAPASFTGEHVAELHLHGGPAVIDAACAALEALGGRAAEPGEFTRRAFANGKLDLVEAEALADLIAAETTAQRRQALDQMAGELSAIYEGWRAELIEISALLEAEIDFPDEEGVPAEIAARARPIMARLERDMAAHLDDRARGQRIRDGFSIVLLGAPNAGKSSLLNRLAGAEAAIVSDIPGTTRDAIEVRLDLGGFLVALIDTAGLREAGGDAIEEEGMRRARARAAEADLRIGVVDAAAGGVDAQIAALDLQADDLVALNKIDAAPGAFHDYAARKDGGPEVCAISARTGEGVDGLLSRLAEIVADRLGRREAPALTRARHRQAVAEAAAALARADAALDHGAELAAEDIRLAARALGRLTGAVDVEDVLGAIFSKFCIGK